MPSAHACYSHPVSTRGDDVRAKFDEHFGAGAAVAVHVPGRVILLGETLGSAHLPLLGFTLTGGVTAAASADESGDFRFASDAYQPAGAFTRAAHDSPIAAPWQRCVAGAMRALGGVSPGQGARLFFTSDVPKGAGLGSRAAMTTAVTAALSAAWGHGREPEALAALAKAAQRDAGFEAEGGDQQIFVHSGDGSLVLVEMAPASTENIALPAGYTFVVATLERTKESVNAARPMRDERVVGARIAAVMLADQVGLDSGATPRLADVAAVEVVPLLAEELPEKMSAREVARGLTVNQEHLVQLTAGRLDPLAKLPVRRVARHLLGEADRVEGARAALAAGDVAAFGNVLDASHDSLRQDFQTTSGAIDTLCAALRRAGALGARAIGDGTDAAVALCTNDKTAAVCEAATAAGAIEVFEARPAGAMAWL